MSPKRSDGGRRRPPKATPSAAAIYVDADSNPVYFHLLADDEGNVKAGWYRQERESQRGDPDHQVIRYVLSGPFATEAEALK